MNKEVKQFEEIPQGAVAEINFLLGDDVSCDEILRPTLEQFGIEFDAGDYFLWEAEDEPEIAVAIYNDVVRFYFEEV